jgi:hypothetical protein
MKTIDYIPTSKIERATKLVNCCKSGRKLFEVLRKNSKL